MAPDSRFWRRRLGEAITQGRRLLLNAVIPLLLLLTISAGNVQARTEPASNSRDEIPAVHLAQEKSSGSESLLLTTLSPPSTVFSSIAASPVAQPSNGNQIHIPDHPTIQKYVCSYKGKERNTFMVALERSWSYVSIMAEILESHGVPAEMAYIPLVESRFKGNASYRGAGGYWQLLAGTARKLGLRVDRWVDERKDPIKSTHAAAKYLRLFYEQFQSWPLALAAYNAGNAPVMSAMRRCRTDNFWELARKGGLPGRTSNYVAKVLAAIQIVRDLDTHGFDRPGKYQVYDFESIWVKAPLKLDQVANWLDVPLNHIRDLNPSLSQDQVPPNSNFDLRLPSGARDKFNVASGGYVTR